jgi:HEAT repeat protein
MLIEPWQHFGEYKELLDLVKTKKATIVKLAVPLLSRFASSFPEHVAAAIDVIVDLCEDDDLAVRLVAIRALPAICEAVPEHTAATADVLTQLLQSGMSIVA